MTISNQDGKMNVFAKEPRMYISDADAQQHAKQTYAERAELANSRAAMAGIAIGLISKITTGSFFFFGLFN